MDPIAKKDDLSIRIKNQETKAFHELYQTAFLPLQRYAMRYLYNWKEAEDLVQDAFLSLWTNLDRYDSKTPVFHYLLGTVKNNCMNHLRALDISIKHQDKIIETLLFSRIEDPDMDEEILQRLNDVLELLPEKQRQVVLLHVVENKKIKEIAEQMGIAETTVKTHFKRAMNLLRNNLKFILIGF